jgi:hypothetical protein
VSSSTVVCARHMYCAADVCVVSCSSSGYAVCIFRCCVRTDLREALICNSWLVACTECDRSTP